MLTETALQLTLSMLTETALQLTSGFMINTLAKLDFRTCLGCQSIWTLTDWQFQKYTTPSHCSYRYVTDHCNVVKMICEDIKFANK